jgi:predicted amidohydrolase
MRVAAVQLEAKLADVDVNLAACERLADQAGRDGAEAIVLPEFFTTGIGFDERLAGAALSPDGAATELLRGLARRHGAIVGGSFLCRDADGEVRNAFFITDSSGELAGRHDKDLPTMWENSFYVGGADDGVIDVDGLSVGAAVCWELMRSQTVHRLRGRIDLALTGSGWWSLSENWSPRNFLQGLEDANERLALRAAETFALYVGAPVAHAAHAGKLECALPWSPLPYRGRFEGGTMLVEADGTVVARRTRDEGEGFVVGELTPARREPLEQPPNRFWLHRRGALAAFAWNYQRLHGRRWYRRHVGAAANS